MRFILVFMLSLGAALSLHADSPKWHDSLQDLENKPTFVMVETDYCPWCKKMKETTLQKPEVLAKLQHFNSVKMRKRAWNKEGIAHVRLVPGLVFLDQNAQLAARFNGYKDSDEFIEILETILQENRS
ncbi:MAG: thioredoxin family protein [Campylobacterota bacterium]